MRESGHTWGQPRIWGTYGDTFCEEFVAKYGDHIQFLRVLLVFRSGTHVLKEAHSQALLSSESLGVEDCRETEAGDVGKTQALVAL